jgi:hypothetical protein
MRDNINEIKLEDLENALKQSKKRMSRGVDNINIEPWKYGERKLKEALLKHLETRENT